MPAVLRAIQGDITKVATEAIVNAANSSLLGGGGQVQASPAIQEVVFCCFSAGDLAVYEAALRETAV